MALKYIRELATGTPQTSDEIAFDDGTPQAKKTNIDKLPISFNSLTDTPNNMSDNPGKRVEVNPQGTGLLYTPRPTEVYKEYCQDSTDKIIHSGSGYGAWVDICSFQVDYNITKNSARFFFQMLLLEQGGRDGIVQIGIKKNGVDPLEWIEETIEPHRDGLVSGFAINSIEEYAVGDTVTLAVRGYSDSIGFDLSVIGTQDPSYFEIEVGDVVSEGGIKTGWNYYTGTLPTYVSTTNGVDTILFSGTDLTDITQQGDWIRIASLAGNDLIYKVRSVSFSTNTTMEVTGETSVSGTITAVSFSKENTPQGVNFSWHNIGESGEPSYENNWESFGSPYNGAGFKREGNIVYVRGLIKNGLINSSIFTLPQGYRPLDGEHLISSVSNDSSTNDISNIRIALNGSIQLSRESSSFGIIECSFLI